MSMSPGLKVAALIAGSLVITAVSPFFGLSIISPADIFVPDNPDAEVFWRLRAPRAAAAFLSGAGLALSGMVFQAFFRNPLATPFTLGVSSGASFGASVYFFVGGHFLVRLGGVGPLFASLVGAGLSMFLVWSITRVKGGFSTVIMLLAGVVINFFFSSLVLFVQYLSDSHDSLRIMHWLMGSLAGLETARLADLAFVILAGLAVIRLMASEIDLLTAGEEIAASRGVRVGFTKLKIFLAASIMVGSVVSLAGPIGFVGLMVPHACRLTLGWSHRILIPAVFFTGGCFLVLCDLASRVILAPAEIPIGIVTSMLGGPFFLWTLFRSQKTGDLF
ncbi:MAG: iron ABC transporter permease [Deltaproteobacteria bacterium]|jgi:iron complex transport system permease protein|nr:iron ABC transporter permease [Deltaproteobacteria bacterium]